MAGPSTLRTFIGCLLALAFVAPQHISAQGTEFVYISNVTGTEAGGTALVSVA